MFFFSSLARFNYLSIFFRFLSFSHCGPPERQNQVHGNFSIFFFFLFFNITRSGLLFGIKESREFLCVILLDGFLLAHIPFGDTVKIQILA